MPEIKSINNILICDVTARESIEDIEKNYATKLDLETRANKLHEHPQYLTEHQNLSGYATKDYVNEVVQNVQGGGTIDLSLYATKLDLGSYVSKAELNSKGYLTMIPSEYITEVELVNKKYATKEYVLELITSLDLSGGSEGGFNIDLSDYALKTDIPSLEGYALKTDIPSLSGYVKTAALEDYYTKSAIDIMISNRVLSADFSSFKGSVGSTIDALREKIEELEAEIEALKNGQVTPSEPTITYGDIIINKSSLSINEGDTATFTVKLDKAPTQNQTVRLSVDNNNATLSKSSLTFTSSDYSTTQTITVTGVKDTSSYSNKTAVITISSDNVSSKIINVSIVNTDVEPSEPEEPTEIPCTDIMLSDYTLTFEALNTSITLIAEVTPSNTTDTIVWKSSKENIATVINGRVTAIAEGNCVITATCGSQSASCGITVEIKEPEVDKPCTSITLDKSSLTFTAIDDFEGLTATVIPTNTTDSIVWESSNKSVATVYNGSVTAKGAGTCIITATCGSQSATCSVTVNVEESDNTAEIILEPTSMTITAIGQSRSIMATLSDGSTGTFTWESNKPEVATVSNTGVVTSVSDGECIITVRCGSVSARCLVDVITNIPCTSVAISQPTLSFDYLGIYKTLTGMVSPENCTETPIWSSDNEEVAVVNNIGKVTSVGPGQCTITFTCGSKSESCAVTVAEDAIAGGEHTVTPKANLLYTSPTMTMEGVKAKLTQNGISQYFDVSYVVNPGHSQYERNEEITDADGNKYYIAVLKEGTSSFGTNESHYDSGGWFKCVDIYGEGYEATNMPYAIYNSTTNYTVKNVNLVNSVLQKALDNFNQTLPAINVTIDSNSENYIHRLELTDTFFAVCRFRGEMFYIEMNESTMLPKHGDMISTETVYNTEDNSWVAIMVHEFGHLLGVADHATHTPTIYDYSIDTDRCLYLQPNDIEFIKYMWKHEFDTDIQTYQDLGAAANPLLNINVNIFSTKKKQYEYKPMDYFSYEHIEDLGKASDAIVNGTLKYNRTEELDIGGSIFEYHIYDIVPNNIEKGELINKELKVLVSQNIEIKDNTQYKLYLKQYDNCPCSLIHPYQGIEEI